MNIRKPGMGSGAEARGGVKVAFVPVSVSVSHPVDLVVCAVLAVGWRTVSRLREIRMGAGEVVASGIPGAVSVPAAGDSREVSCLQCTFDRLEPWYPRYARDLSDAYFDGSSGVSGGLSISLPDEPGSIYDGCVLKGVE